MFNFFIIKINLLHIKMNKCMYALQFIIFKKNNLFSILIKNINIEYLI